MKTCLVVDDSKVIRKVVRKILEELSFNVIEAGDGQEALVVCTEAMPDDPRPFLQLGAYLRAKGHAEEAVEILQVAVDLMEEDRPSPQVLEELGLAQADAEDDDAAIQTLERVVRLFVNRAAVDSFPPGGTAVLAKLHEKRGDLARAADLWSSLARGTDRSGHLRYHREAGRVLAKLGFRPTGVTRPRYSAARRAEVPCREFALDLSEADVSPDLCPIAA